MKCVRALNNRRVSECITPLIVAQFTSAKESDYSKCDERKAFPYVSYIAKSPLYSSAALNELSEAVVCLRCKVMENNLFCLADVDSEVSMRRRVRHSVWPILVVNNHSQSLVSIVIISEEGLILIWGCFLAGPE